MARGGLKKKELFSDQNSYSKQIENIKKCIAHSDELFIAHYRSKYNQPNPPAWMVMELVSFNQLSRWYQNLKEKEIKKKISLHFDSNYIELESWIHTTVYLRNICAHHGRLWNRVLRISPKFPQKELPGQFIKVDGITNGRLYYSLSILLYFLNAVNPSSSFRKRLLQLLAEYPRVELKIMGFPSHWKEELLWQMGE